MKNKFDFSEIVRVRSKKLKLSKLNGRLGIIRGKSQSEEDPSIFAYSVDILGKHGEVITCKFIFENDLEPTGKKADPTKMYTGESIKVRVNPETGESEIVED